MQIWAAAITQAKCPPLILATPLYTSGEGNKKLKRVGNKSVNWGGGKEMKHISEMALLQPLSTGEAAENTVVGIRSADHASPSIRGSSY
jgi:hypothetical protein